MNTDHLAIHADLDADTARIVEGGLTAYNEMHTGPDPSKPFWIVARRDDGTVSGGLQAFVQWDWLAIEMLWVREGDRGQGLGSRLLSAAEAAGLERGCKRVRLATVTFQAPAFYEKFGYREICRLPDVPPGHSYIWMTKTLSA